MEKKLIATIDRDGNVTIEAVGYTGASCQKAIDRIFGGEGETISTEVKSEFYLSCEEENRPEYLTH